MDYPLAVRSSSLLEDSLKYAFAGKYLTTYITNRGSMDERLNQLETAIKKVFASTHGPNAAAYRKKHNLKGEKMAIIVQRLWGSKSRTSCPNCLTAPISLLISM
jgi:phosphoenolpyruvate synthase/pyruvate phosphate dikinase